MAVKVIGLKELNQALGQMSKNIEDLGYIGQLLDMELRKHAHVLTGFMKSQVYHQNRKDPIAGSKAPYSGFEADRGGDHDFGQRAVDSFPFDRYADWIVRPF